MKYALATILFVHALIHSLGFLQAFNLTKATPLSSPTPPLLGLIWLLASFLLLVTIVLWVRQASAWWIIGAGALILSQSLIIIAWSDAKFGSLPNILLLVVLVLGVAKRALRVENELTRNQLIAAAQPTDSLPTIAKDLPASVKNWLRNSGVQPHLDPAWIAISQELKMKLSPEQKNWYTATAEQVVTTSPPAFIWTVCLRMNAFAQVNGRDVLANESGSTLMKLWSLIPVARAGNNPKTNEAALQRYLAEMAWYPLAAAGPNITWEPIDHLTAKATITVNGLKGSGTFHFTEKGEFQKFIAERYYRSDSSAKRIPWVVEVLERGSVNSLNIPTKLKVSWMLPEGIWTWLEVRIIDIQYHMPT